MNGNVFDWNNMIEDASSGEVFLKVLFYGGEASGKTTSVLHGAPKPLLVFDIEKGCKMYAKSIGFQVFKSPNPEHIKAFLQQLKAMQDAGQPLPYRSLFLDSGTKFYEDIKFTAVDTIALNEGKPEKIKLEPNEHDAAKKPFYEIIKLMKDLDLHVFISAHEADNYLKNAFMKIDPNKPTKPLCEKRLPHEMDVVIRVSKSGKTFKAQIEKSRLEDKDGNPLLPATIDKYDNKKLVNMIHEMAQQDRGFQVEKPQQQNIVQNDAELSGMQEEIITIMTGNFKMTDEQAVQQLLQWTNGQVNNPYALNKQQAGEILQYLRQQLGNQQSNQEG